MSKDRAIHPVRISMSVRVSDDSFESTFSFPVSAGSEQINEVTKAWIGALHSAMQMTSAKKDD